MIVVPIILGGLGLVCILAKANLLGVLIGIQLMLLGAGTLFVLAGAASGLSVQGHLFGIFVVLSGVTQLVVGYSIAIRLFYLKRKVNMDSLKGLKH